MSGIPSSSSRGLFRTPLQNFDSPPFRVSQISPPQLLKNLRQDKPDTHHDDGIPDYGTYASKPLTRKVVPPVVGYTPEQPHPQSHFGQSSYQSSDHEEAMFDPSPNSFKAAAPPMRIQQPTPCSPYSPYTSSPEYSRFQGMLSPLISSTLNNEEFRAISKQILGDAKDAGGSRGQIESLLIRKLFEGIVKNERLIDISTNNELWNRLFEFEEFEEIDCGAENTHYFAFKNRKIAISRGFFLSKPIDRRGVRKQLIDLGKDVCHCGEVVKENHLTLRCSVPTCKKKYHRGCVGWSGRYANFFECPRCVILCNDPIHAVQKILIEPSILARQVDYSFALLSEDKKLIKENEEFGVEIRCIKMQFEHYFEQSWPDITKITLNERLVVEEKPTSDKKRRDRKPFLKKGLMDDELNTLHIQYSDHYDKKNKLSDFVICVVLVRKLKEKDICENIIETSRLDIEDCKKFIAAQTRQYGKDVQAQLYTCDLVCKLTLKPIKIPVRGVYCTHLQCFSLDNFVKIISKSDYRVWNCTICQKPSHRLVFDLVCSNVIFKAMEQKQQTGTYPIKFTVDAHLNIRLLTEEEILAESSQSMKELANSITPKAIAPAEPIPLLVNEPQQTIEEQNVPALNQNRAVNRPVKNNFTASHNHKSAHKMPLIRRTKLGQNIQVMPYDAMQQKSAEKDVSERRKDRVMFVSQRERENVAGGAATQDDDLGCLEILSKRPLPQDLDMDFSETNKMFGAPNASASAAPPTNPSLQPATCTETQSPPRQNSTITAETETCLSSAPGAPALPEEDQISFDF